MNVLVKNTVKFNYAEKATVDAIIYKFCISLCIILITIGRSTDEKIHKTEKEATSKIAFGKFH